MITLTQQSEQFVALVNQLIAHRRTVKPEKYSGEKVPDAIIRQMLENANWAPNHGLNEPWRFTVFTGDARQKLADFLSTWYKENTPAEKFQPTKMEKYQSRPLLASHVIAIAMHRREKTKIPVLEDIEAVACAVQNMHLTATAYGVAGYWNTGGAVYSDEMKSFLGLRDQDRCLGLFYVGYPLGDVPEGKRGNYEEKVIWKH